MAPPQHIREFQTLKKSGFFGPRCRYANFETKQQQVKQLPVQYDCRPATSIVYSIVRYWQALLLNKQAGVITWVLSTSCGMRWLLKAMARYTARHAVVVDDRPDLTPLSERYWLALSAFAAWRIDRPISQTESDGSRPFFILICIDLLSTFCRKMHGIVLNCTEPQLNEKF